uniref:Uncharacterized protein n=1 Tax=Triticum urartu TaxID=4572 RepID=A0A8R7TX55_TRIUA
RTIGQNRCHRLPIYTNGHYQVSSCSGPSLCDI